MQNYATSTYTLNSNLTTKTGLNESTLHLIVSTILTHINDVMYIKIFGSRALGTHHKYSDIDIAISTTNNNQNTTNAKEHIEENTIYFTDMLIYEQITNNNLKAHIDEHATTLYQNQRGDTNRNNI